MIYTVDYTHTHTYGYMYIYIPDIYAFPDVELKSNKLLQLQCLVLLIQASYQGVQLSLWAVPLPCNAPLCAYSCAFFPSHSRLDGGR